MILAASIGLICIGAFLLVGGLCKAAHRGDELIQNELDAEELNAINKKNNERRFRSCIWKILE